MNGSFKRAKDQIDIELKRDCIWKYIWFCILLKYYLSSYLVRGIAVYICHIKTSSIYKLDVQYSISSKTYMIHLWECSIQENHIRCGWNGIFYLLDLLIVYSFSFSCTKTSANWFSAIFRLDYLSSGILVAKLKTSWKTNKKPIL